MERKLVKIDHITADQLATYGEIQGLYKRGKETFKIPLESIAVRENFNYRVDFGDIRDYAEFLKSGGEYDPITVDILKGGTAVIIDGERTYRAHLLLREEGVTGFETVLCFRSPANLDEAQRRCKQISKNNRKNFTNLELAEAFRDLNVNHGMSAADIARETGYNTMHISNQLRLGALSPEEKELIKDGEVSATTMLNMVKAGMDEETRIESVRAAQSSAGDNGGGSNKPKVKAKDIVVLGELDHQPLDLDKDTVHSLFKSAFTHLTMLNRLIGMNSKMSDVTFKLENDLRNTVKLLKIMGSYGPEGLQPVKNDEDALDPLFQEAALMVVKMQLASTSLIQRKMKLGYNRANRIMDQLEAKNVVGPFLGTAPREILFADDDSIKTYLAEFEQTPVTGEEDDQPF